MRQMILNEQRAAPALTLSELPWFATHSRGVLPAPATEDDAPWPPLLDGQRTPYINLDNTPSTTPLPAV